MTKRRIEVEVQKDYQRDKPQAEFGCCSIWVLLFVLFCVSVTAIVGPRVRQFAAQSVSEEKRYQP